jgi:hypothetical protein
VREAELRDERTKQTFNVQRSTFKYEEEQRSEDPPTRKATARQAEDRGAAVIKENGAREGAVFQSDMLTG